MSGARLQMRRRTLVAIGVLLFAAAGLMSDWAAAHVPGSRRTLRVLFVGNSYTYFNRFDASIVHNPPGQYPGARRASVSPRDHRCRDAGRIPLSRQLYG